MNAEPASLSLSDDDRAMLSEHAETVQTEAKKTFSLKDRLSGIKASTAKIVLFTDPDAARAFAEKDTTATALSGLLADESLDEQLRAEVQHDFDSVDAEREQLRAVFMRTALAVHMRAVPQVVTDRAQRNARKAYALNDGTVPNERREDFFEMQNHEILGQVIQRIVDADGADAEFDPKTVGAELRDFLPQPQYQRLLNAFNQLVFNDALAAQATADPGF